MIEVEIVNNTMWVVSDMEIIAMVIGGFLLGIFICGLYWYIYVMQIRKKEYMKTLNDEEYRKYNEKHTE